ncbi:MAG: ZIP family metal transporter [Actinomycetota bacterium]|nr:ZIP family metal transporter [Actinomycetota bacterium]
MVSLLVASLTFFSTSLGGLAAIHFRDRMHILLGFSSGAVLGVVFFDVFPELIQQIQRNSLSVTRVMVVIVAGFMAFFLLERLTRLHAGREHEHQAHVRHPQELGVVGAAGLSFHSFLDGVAIGVAFKTSTAIGAVVAIAVLAHDFSDGLNTVTVVLAHNNPLKRARRWLLVDATTPLLGAATVLIAHIPPTVTPWMLAFFIGFFLYISSSDLLPEAREHDSPWVAVAALAGLAVLFAVTQALADFG